MQHKRWVLCCYLVGLILSYGLCILVSFILHIIIWYFFCRKNVPDYSASREKSDLGHVTFDLQAGILLNIFQL